MPERKKEKKKKYKKKKEKKESNNRAVITTKNTSVKIEQNGTSEVRELEGRGRENGQGLPDIR